MTARVGKANKASIAELETCVPKTITLKDTTYHMRVAKVTTLSDEEREAVWQLVSDNMKDMLTKSSLGWNDHDKKKEILHRNSRFLLASLPADDPESTPQKPNLAAVLVFRFVMEEKQPVAYCYELQVSGAYRRSGLGRALLSMLSDIGSKWSMQKVMLTVLQANVSAIHFYKSLGLTLDGFSPGYTDELDGEFKMDSDDEKDGFDYWILSRVLQRPR
ncbi:acyl-CoA N-acyltransferase [Amylostereum chailletii]|nr:acyl-CoA N-acyltransferase [Amylostereum chailletii]